jgi:hypothetical protein
MRRIFFRQRKQDTIEQAADVTVVRAGVNRVQLRQTNRMDRVAARRENASNRREQRAEIVKHRKWIFISMAVTVIVALTFFCIIKFGGFL